MEQGTLRQTPATGSSAPDPDDLPDRLRERYGEIKRAEVETALDRLSAREDLSERERAVIEEMADRIVAGVLAPVTEGAEDGARDADPDDLATLARLFEPGPDP